MSQTAEVLDNPKSLRIKHLVELQSAKGRRKVQKTLVEAPQAVYEVLTCMHDRVTDLYYCVQSVSDHAVVRVHELMQLARERGIYVHEVSARVMRSVSADAQGIVAVLDTHNLVQSLEGLSDVQQTYNSTSQQPSAQDLTVRNASAQCAEQHMSVFRDASAQVHGADRGSTLYAAFWQVRDPGNAGTLLRSAVAAGCNAVVLIDECVDVLSPKVLRASVGAFAHIRIIQASLDEFLAYCAARYIRVYAADVYGTAKHPPIDISDVLQSMFQGDDAATSFWGDAAVLFGNEARGLEDDVIDRCDGTLTVPMYGQTESMNVAMSASIMLHSLAMARHKR